MAPTVVSWDGTPNVMGCRPCGYYRFGLSWQIIPRQLGEMLGDPDRKRAGRAMETMLKMTKIDVAALRRAFEGDPVP